MTTNDPLLQPFKLKHLTLKNRVLSTSHAPAYVDEGKPKQRYQLYHEEKAKGGLAMTMFGGSTNIAPDSPSVFGQIYAGDDGIIPYFREFADRIHKHDCYLMCQLTHMGRRTVWNQGHWLPVIAPSRVREPAHRAFPREMDKEDIDRVVKCFGDTAVRCKDGGLDGIEILAHGHLVDQFISAATNKRDDEYGGSLMNRCRFAREVLEEVRRRVGDDFVVGIRIGMDEEFEGGTTSEESLEVAKHLESLGLLDFFNFNRGHIETDHALAYHIPGMGLPQIPGEDRLRLFRGEIKLPMFHAGRVGEIATARHMIREDVVDMIGMTRGHMADPYIIAKLTRGDEERIRPCVGAGYCLDRLYIEGDALCIQNAATGREATIPHVIPKAPAKKKIVVVGGGPAGLEAARVSAERGHDVVLFEATDRLGGQIVLAARATWRRDLIGIADWLISEIEVLGVEVRLNTFAETSDILAETPDAIIVATGGLPDTDCVEGGENCISVWDILGGNAAPGDDILIYDDNGQHPGPSCADYLSSLGKQVELVTPDRHAAHEMGTLNFPRYLENFYARGVKLTPDNRVVSVEKHGNQLKVNMVNEYGGLTSERIVDQVVVEHGTIPMAETFYELRGQSRNNGEIDFEAITEEKPQDLVRNPDGAFVLYRVGDAMSSRNIHAALYDSLRLCKDL